MTKDVTLANGLRRLNESRGKSALRILMTDEIRLPDPLSVVSRLPAETVIVLRHYGAARRGELASRLVQRGRRRRIRVWIAGDGRLASAVGAAGIHLPEYCARHGVLSPLLGWRRRKGWSLSIACHDRQALARARMLRADLAVLSPVFPTNSHPGQRCLGGVRFRQWCRGAGLPVVALGGIDAVSIKGLRESGAAGIAGISGIFS